MTIPNVLTIAGSDPSGGAGIQADLKAFSAMKVYGASVITALTAQNTQAVTGVHDVPPAFITAQLDAVLSDLDIAAVKIGMLSQPEVIEVVASALERHAVRTIVLDPVMVAKSGDDLLQPEAVDTLKHRLLPMATVITPNLPEAGVLLGAQAPADEDSMVQAAEALRDLGASAVLMKGGHLTGEICVDLLVDEGGVTRYASTRIHTENTHGTGCSLSSAIAAALAHGMALPEAVREATRWLGGAIKSADDLQVGHGHGPVHHFHQLWG
ncbi:MAG: bifunctional hydroxymethylpyrimidine kinase/phosphomethylpyrimidine kinase [Bradymonadia bacterium]